MEGTTIITNLIGTGILWGVIIILLLVYIFWIGKVYGMKKRNNVEASYGYRKYLTNMYVAGKIRNLAEKDNVDIPKEEDDFIQYITRTNEEKKKDLDEEIEEELKQKVYEKE